MARDDVLNSVKILGSVIAAVGIMNTTVSTIYWLGNTGSVPLENLNCLNTPGDGCGGKLVGISVSGLIALTFLIGFWGFYYEERPYLLIFSGITLFWIGMLAISPKVLPTTAPYNYAGYPIFAMFLALLQAETLRKTDPQPTPTV